MRGALLSLLLATAANTEDVGVDPRVAARVTAFELRLGGATDEERAQLLRYLEDLRGRPTTDDTLGEAARRIASIRRYDKARCVPHPQLPAGHVRCDIWRARVLREITVEGLPAAILETDLRKRVFLRPGEPLDDEASTSSRSRLVRQRHRIEDFLAREGFIGAEVRLLVRKVGERGERDVLIRIRGGSFVAVRRVDVTSFGPLSQQKLQEAFGRMCLTSEGLLDGVVMGNLTSCFNKRRLQDTIDRFTAQLREQGYPEGRVRVDTAFVDPAAGVGAGVGAEAGCERSPADLERAARQGLRPAPRCVDLTVRVDAGTRVVARFYEEGADRGLAPVPGVLGGAWLWARETFAEPGSRLLHEAAKSPPSAAADTQLVQPRLREALSFESSGAVDDTELEVSARNLERYLASRGRVDPRVQVRTEDTPGQRAVDFIALQGVVAAVRSVRLVGNTTFSADDILDELELAARPRSFTHAGTVSAAQLEDDKDRIRAFYAERGHPETSVEVSATLSPAGELFVVFRIQEGEPFVIDRVELAGGAPDLAGEVLAALKHCDVWRRKRDSADAPTRGEDCRGAPLRPDELEADAQRVEAVYASHGFPDVEATLETAFSPQGAVVRVTVVPADATAEERQAPRPGNVKQVVLGEVFLEGNHRTQRDVLLREAGLEGKTGEPLDPVRLGKGISRLRRTGLYDSVEFAYLGLDGRSERAHLRLAVSERPAFTVDTSLGFSTEQLFSWRNEVRHRNAFGTMLDASWLLDFGLFVGRFSQTRTQVRWPRILGTDVSASFVPIAVSYLDRPAGVRLQFPATAAGQKATAAWAAPDLRRRLLSAGGSLGLDWRARDLGPLVDERLTVGLAVELRYDWLDPAGAPYRPFSADAGRTLDGLLDVLGTEVTPVATLTPRVAFNSVDNPFDPREGLGFELFFRGSSPPFVRHGPFGVLGLTARAYRTFFERLTLAVGGRARLGFSAPSAACEAPGCEWALMQNDLLLLGGERSVRGVPENQIGVFGPAYDQQLNPVLDEDGQPLLQLRPGFYGATANVELRYTLIRQFFIGDLKPAVFADVGISTDDFAFAVFRDRGDGPEPSYAASVGAGIRYVLPVGPLSIDFAYSPTRNTFGGYVLFGYVF